MKAAYLTQKAGPDSLVLGDIPTPVPATGEALVKVHATAVMPSELDWSPTFCQKSGSPRNFPIVLSHEFSGVVQELGRGVTNIGVDDAVYGVNDWFMNGALAQYCVVASSAVAPKPVTLDHASAAVVPISALTAWQALFERLKVQKGQRLLIHGATGAVGTFATQLAASRDVHVIATTSAPNAAFARELGAREVIDYRSQRFDEILHDIDAVFDCVGGETLDRSWNVLARGGQVVTIVSEASRLDTQRNRDAFMLVQVNGSQLREIGALIDAGKLRVIVEVTYPLNNVREAFAKAARGGMRGKIAVQIAAG